MRLLVTSAARLAIDPAGRLWTDNASVAYPFWQSYLGIFDQVQVCARALQCVTEPRGWVEATGPGVVAAPLSYYQGLSQYFLCLASLKLEISKHSAETEAIILRMPCNIAGLFRKQLPSSRPYGVEMIGDPYDVFAPGAVRHPLRPVLRLWAPRVARREAAKAPAIAYVTERALQHRYPPHEGSFSTWYSDVQLGATSFATDVPAQKKWPGPFTIVFVGSLEQLYKGPDVLLDAAAQCLDLGVDIVVRFIGDGRHRPELENKSMKLGINHRVTFVGSLSNSSAVIKELDQATIFVLPSRTEGLPKALIEAMARGLPCIASQVGGIPELLSPEDLVQPGQSVSLAQRLISVLKSVEERERMSRRNLQRARDFSETEMTRRKAEFLLYLRNLTEAWSFIRSEATTRVSTGFPFMKSLK